jgi:predicted nucleotidyltransferase
MGEASAEVVKLVKDFKEKAGKKYGIKKIILFGSQVTGNIRDGSDIDLLIVSDKFKRKTEFMSQLAVEWHIIQKKKFPVDFLPYKTKEFRELSKKITIVKQALEEGIEI